MNAVSLQHRHVTGLGASRVEGLIRLHITYLRAENKRPQTVTARRRVLAVIDQALPYGLCNASTDELAAYFAYPSWSAWTRATYFGHAAGFYRWAAGGINPYLTLDPMASLRRPRTPRGIPNPVSTDELRYALERATTFWRRVILLAAYAGLRAGEIVALRREDVTRERVHVVDGKGGKTADVPTHPIIWQNVAGAPAGLLVAGERLGRPITRARLSLMARKFFDAIGLPDVYLHRFRHWYGTMLLRAGANMRTVQECMRHESLASTAIYTRVDSAQRVAAIASLPS